MEKDEAVEEHIKYIESLFPSDVIEGWSHKMDMNRLRVLGLDPGKAMVRAGPLFELLSVSVHSNNRKVVDGKPCQIYGSIVVLDEVENGNMYVLYNRDKNDPEKVRLNGKLSLNGYPFSPAKPQKIVIILKDAVRDLMLVNGYFNLEYKSECDYETCKVANVSGEYGSVEIRHNTFNSAFVGTFSVSVIKLKDDERDSVDIYGRITTRLDDYYMKKMDAKDCFLFKRDQDESVTVSSNGRIDLSRSRVVVPACSSVRIAVELFEADTESKITLDEVEIPTQERFSDSQWICEEDYEIQVSVDWMHPEELFERKLNYPFVDPIEPSKISLYMLSIHNKRREKRRKKRMLKTLAPPLSSYDVDGVSDADAEDVSKEQEIQKHRARVAAVRAASRMQRLPDSMIGVCLVEVFSVVVDRVENCVGIYGTIKIHDSLGTQSMFKRDCNLYETLPKSRKNLFLPGPMTRSVIFDDFRLTVRLKDDKSRAVSEGYIEWAGGAEDYLSWYDRRTCSIIEGECGFAAVYYTIFSSAAQAMLNVVLSSNKKGKGAEVGVRVWGSITARYSKYKYSTYYDSEYYQSILFKEHMEKPLDLNGNGNSEALLPLSKYAISAPLDCSLLITLDLVVIDRDTVDGGVVQGVLEFKPFCNVSQSIKTSNGFDITVGAEWELPKLPHELPEQTHA